MGLGARTIRGTGPLSVGPAAGRARRASVTTARWTVDLHYHVLGLHVKELAKDPTTGLALAPCPDGGGYLVYGPAVAGYSVSVALRLRRGRDRDGGFVDISSWFGLPSGYRAREGDGLVPANFRMARVDHARRAILLWTTGDGG